MIIPYLPVIKLVIVVAAIAGTLGYSYNLGYNSAADKYTKIITKYEDDVNVKIENIENLATTLSKDLKNSEITISKDLKTIIINSRKSPPTIIVDGKCVPSEEYKQAIRDMRTKANAGITPEVKK